MSNEIVKRNGIELSYIDETHTYRDQNGQVYTSVTTLVKNSFPEFDSLSVAINKSLETGVPVKEYLQEWKEIGEKAAAEGTRMHENIENLILHEEKLSPRSAAEERMFEASSSQVKKLAKKYFLRPELIIFSPKYKVAGRIDLLGTSQTHYLLADWKKVKKLSKYSSKTGIVPATSHLKDCNFIHYSLQLAIYEQILREERYIQPQFPLRKVLFQYNPVSNDFDSIIPEDLTEESKKLLESNI